MKHAAFLLASALVMAGCMSLKSPPSIEQEMVFTPDTQILQGRPTGMIRLALGGRKTQALPATTTQFSISIGGPDISPPIEIKADAQQSTVRVLVPAGTERSILIDALNAQDKIVASYHQEGIVVTQGQFTQVSAILVSKVGNLTGTVTNTETGLAEAGVAVSAGEVSVLTDASGSYKIEDLATGSYEVGFSKLAFSSATQSIVVTSGNTSQVSQNLNCKHWLAQVSGTTADLHGIQALSLNEAWAYGSSNTLLHTTDGGLNWKSVVLPDSVSNSETAACFLNTQEGFAINRTRIYHTTDGGSTWINCLLPNAAPPSNQTTPSKVSIAATNPNCLLASVTFPSYSDPRYVYRYLGSDWASPSFECCYNPASEGRVHAIEGDSFFYTACDRVLRTNNNGLSWSDLGADPLIIYNCGVTYECFQNVVGDTQTAYLVGYVGGNRAIAKSTNGGANWESVYIDASTGVLLDIAKMGTGYCAVGNDGGVIVQRPGSGNWETMAIEPANKADYDLCAVDFFDEKHGWSVGKNGKILKY